MSVNLVCNDKTSVVQELVIIETHLMAEVGHLGSHVVAGRGGEGGGGVQDQDKKGAALDVAEKGVTQATILMGPRH